MKKRKRKKELIKNIDIIEKSKKRKLVVDFKNIKIKKRKLNNNKNQTNNKNKRKNLDDKIETFKYVKYRKKRKT